MAHAKPDFISKSKTAFAAISTAITKACFYAYYMLGTRYTHKGLTRQLRL